MPPTCLKRLKRLQTIVSWHQEQCQALAQVRAMREGIIRLEHIWNAAFAQSRQHISNAEVACRVDAWLKQLASLLQAQGRTHVEPLSLSPSSPSLFGLA